MNESLSTNRFPAMRNEILLPPALHPTVQSQSKQSSLSVNFKRLCSIACFDMGDMTQYRSGMTAFREHPQESHTGDSRIILALTRAGRVETDCALSYLSGRSMKPLRGDPCSTPFACR